MTEFNWDRMPAELKSKLLELGGLDDALESTVWIGLSDEEKKTVNAAMLKQTKGNATMKDCPK